MLEKVDLRCLKTLKTKKINTKNIQIAHVQNMWWYTELIWTIYRTEKKAKKVTKNWNWPFLIPQLLKTSNINTAINVRCSEIRGIIYRQDLHRPEKKSV